MREYLARFLADVDDPDARVKRGTRLASLGLITGGLTAIPVSLLLTGASPWQLVMAAMILALGVTCLAGDWSEKGPYLLYAIALVATGAIALAMAFVTPAFAINYVFIALVVAVTASFRSVMGMTVLITAGLLTPTLIGPDRGVDQLALPIIGGPALFVVSAVAYQLTRMQERSRQVYRHLSRHDELTGIGNYRSMLEKLEEEINRHARHRQKLSLVLLDLDQFKSINDDHGHLYGDDVLIQVARAIGNSVRLEDSIFRQGGDEFAIIAPQTDPDDLDLMIERLQENLSDCGDGDTAITVSTGIAAFPVDETEPMELLATADERLMQAKRDDREYEIR